MPKLKSLPEWTPIDDEKLHHVIGGNFDIEEYGDGYAIILMEPKNYFWRS